MLAALVAQLVKDAHMGLAVLPDWRCVHLDEIALQITRNFGTEVDARLVAALVCGTNDESLLTEPALQAIIQQAVLLLEPAWKTDQESGALPLFDNTLLLYGTLCLDSNCHGQFCVLQQVAMTAKACSTCCAFSTVVCTLQLCSRLAACVWTTTDCSPQSSHCQCRHQHLAMARLTLTQRQPAKKHWCFCCYGSTFLMAA